MKPSRPRCETCSEYVDNEGVCVSDWCPSTAPQRKSRETERSVLTGVGFAIGLGIFALKTGFVVAVIWLVYTALVR